MEHINRQLGINLNKKGLKRIAEASYVCYLFKNIKGKILGKDIKAQAISFRNGILKIKTSDPITASEIRFKGDLIKDKINKKIGAEAVLRIDARF